MLLLSHEVQYHLVNLFSNAVCALERLFLAAAQNAVLLPVRQLIIY